MNVWREKLTQALTWRMALPSRFGLEHVYVHLSAIIALPLAAIGLGASLAAAPNYEELKTAAITLPIVWILSLVIRVAAQLLAIGSHGDDFEMVIGPAGNISNDYERLSGPAMLSYAVAGQSATLLLSFLGLLVLGAVAPSPANGLTLAWILDLQTGWSSNAWASQIVWVNGFLFLLHLLPAAPFDSRALVVGWCQVSRPAMSHAQVHRLLASIDSHLALAIAGFSLAMIVTRLSTMESVAIWYALLVVSIFLLTISQLESYLAQQQDDLAEPLLPRSWKERDTAGSVHRQRRTKLSGEYSELPFGESADAPSDHEVVDVDEILRKLHREGQEALSPLEKEALLTASRELQARRQPRH